MSQPDAEGPCGFYSDPRLARPMSETHVDRVAINAGLLGRYPSADHPDIGAQEREGQATYVYVSTPHTMDDCPFSGGESDYERGLRFLNGLDTEGDRDWEGAGEALFALVEMCVHPDRIERPHVEALGRVIASDAPLG